MKDGSAYSSSPILHEGAIWYSRPILFILATGVFVGAASMRILDSLLPQIAQDYGHSIGTAGMAVTAYALTYSGLQIFFGPLGDRVGPFRVITAATVCSGITAFGCALAPTLGWLVGLRLVAGAIAAAIGPLTLVWISLVTNAERRPVAIANMTGASIAGTTMGQMGGGVLGAFLSWQASFLAIAILFLMSGLFMFYMGRKIPELNAIGRQASNETDRGGLAVLRTISCRPAVRTVLFAVGIEGVAMFMSFTYIAAFLEDELAPGLVNLGMLVAFFGAGGIAFVLIAKPLVRHLAENRRAFVGGALIAVGYCGLIAAPSHLMVAVMMFMLGLGFMTLHNVLQIRATQMAPQAPGAGISLFAATFFSGQALGASFGGWAFDRFGAAILFASSAALLFGLGVVLGWRTEKGMGTTNQDR